MTPENDEPTAQAQAIMERVLRLVRECRLVLRALERPTERGESSSAKAERILYFTLMSAIDAGLIRTMENALSSHSARKRESGDGKLKGHVVELTSPMGYRLPGSPPSPLAPIRSFARR